MKSLQIFSHRPHIIIGTETWLSNDVQDNEIIPEYCNYIIYHNDRSDGYGGIMIAISKHLLRLKLHCSKQTVKYCEHKSL